MEGFILEQKCIFSLQLYTTKKDRCPPTSEMLKFLLFRTYDAYG
jgi:hypothetical protein